MMRIILLSVLILVGLGTTLYQVKTGIDERKDYLSRIEMEIAKTRRDIAALEAEWAYRARAERIISLSGSLLGMKPIGQDRILPLESIPLRPIIDAVAMTPPPALTTHIIKVSE
jgi:hypothetical protein